MKQFVWGILSLVVCASLPARADQIQINVIQGPTADMSEAERAAFKQHIDVYVNGEKIRTYLTSTGLGYPVVDDNGFPTQTSTRLSDEPYPVTALIRDHKSGQYKSVSNPEEGAPMPFAVQFNAKFGQYIHQTVKANLKKLGSPASHGCVRLNKESAEELFNLLSENAIRNSEGRIISIPATVTIYGVVALTDEEMKQRFQEMNGALVTMYKKALETCEVKDAPYGQTTMTVYERKYVRDQYTGVFLSAKSKYLNVWPGDEYGTRCNVQEIK